jgi:hypothetical protein
MSTEVDTQTETTIHPADQATPSSADTANTLAQKGDLIQDFFAQLTKEIHPTPEAKTNVEWLLAKIETLTAECNAWTQKTTEFLQHQERAIPTPKIEEDLLQRINTVQLLSEYDVPLAPYTDHSVQVAALLNFLFSYQVLRKDKSPYTTHPMIVDIIIVLMSKIPPERLTIVRITALVHDIVEEDTLRLLTKRITDPNAGCITPNFELPVEENMLQAKNTLNAVMSEAKPGDIALELMQPQKEGETASYEYKHARFIHWLNWRAERRKDLRTVKLADKIHDLLDLDYILKSESKTSEEKNNALAAKYAKISFSMHNLLLDENGSLQPDVPEGMWQTFLYLLQVRIDALYANDLSAEKTFTQTLKTYQTQYVTQKEQMMDECREYAQKVELWT